MGNEDVLASAVRRPRAFENACWLCFLGVIGGFCVPDGASSKQGTKKKKRYPQISLFFLLFESRSFEREVCDKVSASPAAQD